MPTPTTTQPPSVAQRIVRSQRIIDLCTDSIKMLTGEVPKDSTLTFSIRKNPVVCFDITDSEHDLCLSWFAYWLQFHRNALRELTALQQRELTTLR